MQLSLMLKDTSETTLQMARQIGVQGVVGGVKDEDEGRFIDYRTLVLQKTAIENAGLAFVTVESLRIADEIKLGLPGRQDAMEVFLRHLTNVGNVGIPVVCYNFMAAFGWMRTSISTRTRGSALTSAYDHDKMAQAPLTRYGKVDDEQIWDAFAWFIERAVPVAEQVGVTLALHPDDPPLSPIGGMARIMRSVEAFDRVLGFSDSPANAITFCQGNFDAMGANVPQAIRHFRDRIAFVHFRDVKGTVPKFEETFHDATDGDMAEVIETLIDIGFGGPIRPDHTPTLAGESNETPGYAMLGRLHAIGYMQGLIAAVERSRGAADG